MHFFFRWVMWLGLLQGLLLSAQAQPTVTVPAQQGQVRLLMGPATFPVNEYFTLSFQLTGAPLERYSAFPDIEGFKKSGKSSTTTTRIVEGKSSTELTITQRYAAYKEGEFVLPVVTMTVNGQQARLAGATLKVLPQVAATTAPPTAAPGIGLLDQLFGKQKPQEFVEPRDNAFLAVVPDKSSVFVGEPVHMGLYFYLTPADQGLLDFYDFGGQLPRILRRLQQPAVWVEPSDEQEVLPESTTVGGKPYLRYHLYEAVYYPLTPRALEWPAVDLQMIKYKLPKKSDPTLDNRMTGLKTFVSLPRTVAVRPLPPHPLRDLAVVGSYRLLESIDRTSFRTGQAFTYTLRLEGEGNLSAVNPPPAPVRAGVEVYGPEVHQEVTRASGRVGGYKTFRYRVVAQKPGRLPLDSLFSVAVFDPATRRYQVLRSSLTVDVKGAARPTAISARTTDPYYQSRLFNSDNQLQPITAPVDVRRYANYLLVGLLALAAFGWWRGNTGA
ncbi:BatD family protein [Hymenobacter guriensis]|uniref:BatD family protein n=1 Tax=Hymenobacter guriensis TaxID=2793065 RepID=A0ABS0KY65_9BACT|nr:BatD family protein [Hymenobacter guriensis]MBG8552818.1 BatD family protein [Hymenobacter guriensis]